MKARRVVVRPSCPGELDAAARKQRVHIDLEAMMDVLYKTKSIM
jgi:hypothetical protein